MDEYRMLTSGEATSFLREMVVFFRSVLLFILACVRRFFLVGLISFLVLGGLAWFFWQKQQPYYESDMACTYNELHKKVFGEMISKLDKLVQTGSYGKVSDVLQISEKQASGLLSIKAQNIAGRALYEDLSEERFPFYIVVRAGNREAFNALGPAILNYLNTTPIQILRHQLDSQRIDLKTVMLERDLATADSLIMAYSAGIRLGGNIIKDSSNITKNAITLFDLREKLENNYLDARQAKGRMISVELMHGFMVPDNPQKPAPGKLVSMLGAAFIGSFFICIVAGLLLGIGNEGTWGIRYSLKPEERSTQSKNKP